MGSIKEKENHLLSLEGQSWCGIYIRYIAKKNYETDKEIKKTNTGNTRKG